MAKSKKKPKFRCKRCGICCEKCGSTLSATQADVDLWKREGREDIIQWADPIIVGDGIIIGYDLWCNPETGELVRRCPWLRKVKGKPVYKCLIYDVRPEVCRSYPISEEHVKRDNCPGYTS